MQTPLNASASTAGALLSSSTFEIPQYQREYSWEKEEVEDFWSDLSNSINEDSYFLGLVILTDEGQRKHVVDGQQRLVTLTLLANAIYYEAQERGRKALADRVQADFLRSIDYASDDTDPRITMTDPIDNETLQIILNTGRPPLKLGDEDTVSRRLSESYIYLREQLRADLAIDPFKQLGKWTEFLTHRVYFAVFVHPNPASAYQVFEVINTRGMELTTADLLKNYVISQTQQADRQTRYDQWKSISTQFPSSSSNSFVQYIRHAITVQYGHILPKDLFNFLAQRSKDRGKEPPTPNGLMKILEEYLPLYLQMIDTSVAGPASPDALRIFNALNSLGVIAVRPILLAVSNVPDALNGMKYILQLVVHRIVVGNLGTGNVERRFGEAAKKVYEAKSWAPLVEDLGSLNPERREFIDQLRKRSFNKGVLAFLRQSILTQTMTPDLLGTLHFIWTRQTTAWNGMSQEEGAYWGSTLGNTFLSSQTRRHAEANDWDGFKEYMIPTAIDGEWQEKFSKCDCWSANTVENFGRELAEAAGDVWY